MVPLWIARAAMLPFLRANRQGRITMISLDITMPNKDGIQALKEIKAADPNATCVMCSAMGQQSMVIEAIQSGAKDFIVKPFQADRVLESIRKVLG